MRGLFVTGTGTDTGKTVLSALLLSELRQRCINAAPMKPAQTGCEPGASGLSVPDLDYSLALSQMSTEEDDYALMSPYRYEPACSPHLAAEMADEEIDIAEMVIAARTLSQKYEFIVAEGAGGIMVPLNRRELMLDLMHALNLPVLLAVQAGLGTINHTLLSIRALRSEGLNIVGVVMIASQPGETGFIEMDNPIAIEQFGKVPVLGQIPYCPDLNKKGVHYNALPQELRSEIIKIADALEGSDII